MFNTTSTAGTRRLLARIVVTGSLAALPMGLVAAPTPAAPVTSVDRPWQGDCDHTGHFGWQQNRGHSEWGDCDTDHGHWQWQGDRDGRGQWQWHHDRDDFAPPPPPPPWWWWMPRGFGSSS